MENKYSALRTSREEPSLFEQVRTSAQLTPEAQYELTSGASDSQFQKGLRYAAAGLTAGSFANKALRQEVSDDADWQRSRDLALQTQAQAQMYAPRVSSLRDIRGLGDAADFAAGAFGQGVMSIAPTLATALLTRGRGKYATAGSFAGGAATSYNLERGEAALGQYADPTLAAASVEDRDFAATAKGAVNAGLEAIVPVGLAGSVLRRPAGSLMGEVGRAALTEGLTETAQKGVGFGAEKYLDPSRQLDPWDVADAFAAGALTGGGMTGAVRGPAYGVQAPVDEFAQQSGSNPPSTTTQGAPPDVPLLPGPKDGGGIGGVFDTLNESFTGLREQAQKTKDYVSDTIDRMGEAAKTAQNPGDFLRQVFSNPSEEAAADLRPDTEDPNVLNAADPAAALRQRDVERQARAERFAVQLLNDPATPDAVKKRVVSFSGDFINPEAQAFVARNLLAQRAGEKLTNAVADLIDLSKDFGSKAAETGTDLAAKARGMIDEGMSAAADRIVKKNLQGGDGSGSGVTQFPTHRTRRTDRQQNKDFIESEFAAVVANQEKAVAEAEARVERAKRLNTGRMAEIVAVARTMPPEVFEDNPVYENMTPLERRAFHSITEADEELAFERSVLNDMRKSLEPAKASSTTDRIVKKSLQDVTPAEQATFNKLVFDSLTDEAKASPVVRQRLPELANAMLAFAARTGDLTKADLKTLSRMQDGLAMFRDPEALAAQLTEYAGLPRTEDSFLSRIKRVTNAQQDLRQPNSFLYSSLTEEAKDSLRPAQLKQLARLVDDFTLLDASKSRGDKVLAGLTAAFGSKESAQAVLDYYQQQNRADLRFAPNEMLTEGGMTERDGAPAPTYQFADAKTMRPFRAFAGRMSSEGGMRRRLRESTIAGAALRRSSPGGARVRPVKMSQYVADTGGNPETEVRRIAADLKDRIAQHEARKNEDRTSQINELQGELTLMRQAYKDGGAQAALDLYEVLQVSGLERNDTVATDADVAKMATLADAKDAKGTRVTFQRNDGSKFTLSAESMWKTLGDKEGSGKGEDVQVRAKRLFADAVASVLARPEVAKMVTPMENVLIDRQLGVQAKKKGSPEYRAMVIDALKAAKDNLKQLKKTLDGVVDEYSELADQRLAVDEDLSARRAGQAKSEQYDSRREEIETILDQNITQLSERLSAAREGEGPMAGNKPAQVVAREKLRLYREAQKEIDAIKFEEEFDARDNNRSGMPGGESRGPLGPNKLPRTRMNEELADTGTRYAEEDTGLGVGVEHLGAGRKGAPSERVILPKTSPHAAKDQAKSDRANKFIGRGSPGSSTAAYAEAWGKRANTGEYSSEDTVFISVNGNRPGALAPPWPEIREAMIGGATLITDVLADRNRPFNSGERAVAEYLDNNGYFEKSPGTWVRGYDIDNATGRRRYAPLFENGRQSAMGAKEGGPNKLDQNAIIDEIRRIRGDKVKVLFRKFAEIGGSGEFSMNKDKTNRLIKIAITASNPMGTAWHEALHDFFAMLGEDRVGRAIKRDLTDAAEAPHVKLRLRELLAKHPEALKQLEESPEERVAYMYQFWAEGLLRIGPTGTGIFDRLRRLFRKLLNAVGLVDAEQRAEDLLIALHEGKFAEPSTVAEVLADMPGDRFANKMEKAAPALTDALSKVFDAAPDRLRAYQNDKLTELADMFSSERGKLGFIQKRFQQQGVWENRLAGVLAGTTAQERRAALENMQAMKPPSNNLEEKLADFFTEMHDYMVESGVQTFDSKLEEWVPLRKVKNYFPRMFDRAALMADRDGFIALLQKHGDMDSKQAGSVFDALTHGTGQLELAENEHALGFTPYAQAVQDRRLTFIQPSNASEFAKYQVKDLADITTGYVKQAVHRAEYTRMFGNDGEVIAKMISDSGITNQKELEDIGKIVQGLEGSLGNDMSTTMKELQSGVMTLQNLVLLPLALFSQMLDPIVLAARSGDLRDAGSAYVTALKRLKNTLTQSGQKEPGEELASMLGIISQDSVLEAMGNAYGTAYMSKRTENINRVFFRYNGMQGWNNSMRIAATAAGERYLIANKNNTEALAELGLTPADIVLQDRWTYSKGPDGKYTYEKSGKKLDVSDPKVQQAMYRFVDGAVLRPSPSNRPVWMSDPRFLLVAHLKQFTFAMHNVVLKRATRELADGNPKPWAILMLTMPVVLAADMAKFALTGGVPTSWGFSDYLTHAVERSGLLGLGDFQTQAMKGIDEGQMPGERLLGPTFEHLMDVLRWAGGDPQTSVGDVIDRTVPGARFV